MFIHHVQVVGQDHALLLSAGFREAGLMVCRQQAALSEAVHVLQRYVLQRLSLGDLQALRCTASALRQAMTSEEVWQLAQARLALLCASSGLVWC